MIRKSSSRAVGRPHSTRSALSAAGKFSATLVAVIVAACGGGSTADPGGQTTKDPGTEGGACFPNSTCNAGLACLSNLCVSSGTGGSGGADASVGGGGGTAGDAGDVDSGSEAAAGGGGVGGDGGAAGGNGGEGGTAGTSGDSDLSPIDDPDCTGDCGSSALPYGAVVGVYRGVQAYSNGNTWSCHACADGSALGLACNTRCGYTPVTPYGAAYQCVEYIRRFYASVYGDQTVGQSYGDAKNYITSLPSMGFTCYSNGQSITAPQPDDIAVFTGGSYGHIAIVRAVAANSVTLIHQNARHDASDEYYTIAMSQTGGKYTIGTPPSPLSKYSVAVWCRNPDHDWTKCSATLPCPDGYDCVNGSCSLSTACPGGGNCSGHGTCDSSSSTCTCNPPYTGNDCSSVTCPGSPACSGHGTCNSTTGACTCNSNWMGNDCATPCGTANHSCCPSSVCNAGYSCNGSQQCVLQESCDGVDNDGNGIVDDPASCWKAVYRFVQSSTGARCWGNTPGTPPAGCAGYSTEIEAFIVHSNQVPNTFEGRQCSKGTDHIITRYDTSAGSDYNQLVGVGYDCTVSLGYFYNLGAGPGNTPWAHTCPLYRFSYSTSGGGAHFFTRGPENLSGMSCEAPARADVFTSVSCFASKPAGC